MAAAIGSVLVNATANIYKYHCTGAAAQPIITPLLPICAVEEKQFHGHLAMCLDVTTG